MIGIYKITNLINGKSYIGQSCNISRRRREHKFISSEHNRYLKLAYKKYGREKFSFEILEECKYEELDEKEIYWISKLKPEYNRTSGGKGQKDLKHSLETRKKLREKGKMFWNKLNEEQKQKIINNNLKDHLKGIKLAVKLEKN